VSEASEERQPIVVNLMMSGAYRPPQVESAAAQLAIAKNCSCGSRAGAGAGDECACGSVSGSGA
jgi:hypothetical protein